MTALVWPFAKLSFFLLYLQLFYPITWLRHAIYLGASVNVLFYFSIVVATLYYTTPAPGQSWQEVFGSSREAGALRLTLYIASGSLILDIYIFLLPIFGIWNLQLSRSRKFGVGIVFATGLASVIPNHFYYSLTN